MSVKSLNHAVLFVSDVDASAHFYCATLGFDRLPISVADVAFLRGSNSGNDHDLGLFRASGPAARRGFISLGVGGRNTGRTAYYS
ncbi:VOC family protein [Rhodococcus sp. (in: high G+C Gram-positive bacteria)]|uniref:VOC family protein n=1 Tax=Rhodococcus sp. TaxID=1831 RepID=UPI00338F4DBD